MTTPAQMTLVSMAPDIDTRPPSAGHLNYPGNVASGIRFDKPMGPTYLGELVWPVVAEYDAATHRTRVGFTLVPPAEDVTA